VATARARAQSLGTTRALLVKRVEYGESDLVLTLFTERFGRVSVLARGARRSMRRYGGALEPMHTLEVSLEERPHGELLTLREAKIQELRLPLTGDLGRLQAAGHALGWLRRAAPARTPEPELWLAIVALLDRLATPGDLDPRAVVAGAGHRRRPTVGGALGGGRCERCGEGGPDCAFRATGASGCSASGPKAIPKSSGRVMRTSRSTSSSRCCAPTPAWSDAGTDAGAKKACGRRLRAGG
jgi:DNA repair protein RecO (recombination protein O)